MVLARHSHSLCMRSTEKKDKQATNATSPRRLTLIFIRKGRERSSGHGGSPEGFPPCCRVGSLIWRAICVICLHFSLVGLWWLFYIRCQ
ncbi:unnamed protein product [Tetraodon nigroviridis]|uniref:Chromosome 3 SCAF15050, whole genome shotgun sequence n=1 Tax=Tetraodon nigroviridis TaxID=99883 RepID=Q4RHF7_TETNG|nr:unnamed protein product [Tetraodon nigroviridis]